jgi:hypothetical protein
MDRITQSLVEEASTVWVVVRSPNSEVRQEVARRAIAIAGAGREPVAQERWESVGGPIRVVGFGRGQSE